MRVRRALATTVSPVAAFWRWRSADQKHLFDRLRDRDRYAVVVFDALRWDHTSILSEHYAAREWTRAWSAGHDTFEYGRRVWGDRVYDDVTYVSGAVPINGHRHEFEDDHFNELYGGWAPADTLPELVDAWESCWDADLGAVVPERLTDVACEHADADRLVVHYGQPHAPYVGRNSLLGHTEGDDAKPNTGAPADAPIWRAVHSGDVPLWRLRDAYASNVRRVAAAARPLVRGLLDAGRDVILTADHGELLGDGIGEYDWRRATGHPRIPLPKVRLVPWVEVETVRDYPTGGGEATDASVADRLDALGYR